MKTSRRKIHADDSARKAVILFWVGPYRMGIPASALKETRKSSTFESEPAEPTVIVSAHELWGIPQAAGDRLLILRSGNVGLRVDRVERLIETRSFSPLPRAFQGAEREWYSGIMLEGNSVIPIVNAEAIAREAWTREQNAAVKDALPDRKEVALP